MRCGALLTRKHLQPARVGLGAAFMILKRTPPHPHYAPAPSTPAHRMSHPFLLSGGRPRRCARLAVRLRGDGSDLAEVSVGRGVCCVGIVPLTWEGRGPSHDCPPSPILDWFTSVRAAATRHAI